MSTLREEDLTQSCQLAGEAFYSGEFGDCSSWIPGVKHCFDSSFVLYHTGDLKRFFQSGGDPSSLVVHFLSYDNGAINPLWNPGPAKKRFQFLKGLGVKRIVSPDFSSWADAPLILQLWNYFRSASVTKDFITAGFEIIPNVCWSSPKLFNFSIGIWGKLKKALIDANHVGKDPLMAQVFWAGAEYFHRLNPDTEIVFYGNERNFHQWEELHPNSIRCAPRVEVLHNLSKFLKKGGKPNGYQAQC